ncbi:MAG: response regulator [Acidimicrobiales bacterium]
MHHHETNGPNECVVLHIEHDDAIRRLVEGALDSRADIRLVSASRGKLGLALARLHQPTIVILDMGLPDINGAVVLDFLRIDPLTRMASVIVVSSEPADGHIQQLLESGALAYVIKPFEARDLFAAIDKLIVAPDEQASRTRYGALVPVLPQVAMTPSSVVADLLHAALGATTRAVEQAHGLLELLLPL